MWVVSPTIRSTGISLNGVAFKSKRLPQTVLELGWGSEPLAIFEVWPCCAAASKVLQPSFFGQIFFLMLHIFRLLFRGSHCLFRFSFDRPHISDRYSLVSRHSVSPQKGRTGVYMCCVQHSQLTLCCTHALLPGQMMRMLKVNGNGNTVESPKRKLRSQVTVVWKAECRRRRKKRKLWVQSWPRPLQLILNITCGSCTSYISQSHFCEIPSHMSGFTKLLLKCQFLL